MPGKVAGMMYVPAGYVKIYGATVQRNDYIRLVNLANKYGLWTTDPVNNPGKFGVGNGSTTMVLPDWRGVVRRFLDEGKGYDANRVLGTFQGDAIRNIYGAFGVHAPVSFTPPNTLPCMITFPSGCFYTTNVTQGFGLAGVTGSVNTTMATQAALDVSRITQTALENRMRNIAEMAVMRY